MSLLDVPGFNPAEFQLSDDERRRLLLSNILLGVGAGLSGARRGSEIAGLAQGMAQGGALGQQAVSAAQRAQWDKIKGAGEMLDLADRRAKFDDANRWRNFNATYQGSGNATYDALMERAAAAEQAGFPQQAIAMREQAMKYRPKFSTTPQQGVDKDGQPYMYVLDDAGNEKRISAGAKPDWVATDLGGTTQFVNRNTLPTGGATFAKTVSPDTIYSGDITKRGQDITIRGQNMSDARARESTAVAASNAAGGKVAELRKEFNSLPQVKSYGEVQPVLQSAREALGNDTAAADLNLIYAAAKIMDPNSVVRESETSMVVGSGSPAQRMLGQFNYVAGGGRLTPQARKNLMAEVESRARGYESGYKAARKAYEGVAAKHGLPADEVFIEPFATGAPPKQATGGAGLSAAEAAELAALKRKYGR